MSHRILSCAGCKIKQITLLHLLADELAGLQGVCKAGLCFISIFDVFFLKSCLFKSLLSTFFMTVSLIHLVHAPSLQAFRYNASISVPRIFSGLFFFRGLYIGFLMVLRCQGNFKWEAAHYFPNSIFHPLGVS